MPINISILLATYKRPEVLNRTLASFSSLHSDSVTWDLWVVDNAVDPSTETVVKKWAEKLPIHYLVEPKAGKNNALNLALPGLKGQLVVLTDDDIIASPAWLKQLWEGAQRWPDHMVFGGKIIANWPGVAPFWGEDHPMNQSLFGLHSLGEKEMPYRDNLLPYGANMAVRREIFEKGYNFNPSVGPNGEKVYRMGSETEFLKRLERDGYIPIFLPKAVVEHQIRREQMDMRWVAERSFRSGFTDCAGAMPDGKTLLSVARYLWRQLLVALIMNYIYKIVPNKRKKFSYFVALNRARGKIYAQLSHDEAFSKKIFHKKLLKIIKA
ncbi:glycosyltransferase [Geoalkalibacter halelectricus]|uniref:Glycosyltransferase n=1 Tax=Geoalkalibacter halelectricus TaxID=2847045 RepID=A0ABY5ZN04_9BACT|nr:glycosyltransferase family 2 protein [Geoalkalibacter halelectricus]MDO3379731.1 glycosyltransferase [Geoalkalibacter halelectricus]UWZ79265.1 glycosyltransferase [Geoalkalibacter halelectricus]